jgi:hypothetical protein
LLLKIRYILILVLLSLLFVYCNKAKSKDKKIARVLDEYLYESDIKSILPAGINVKDSVFQIIQITGSGSNFFISRQIKTFPKS